MKRVSSSYHARSEQNFFHLVQLDPEHNAGGLLEEDWRNTDSSNKYRVDRTRQLTSTCASILSAHFQPVAKIITCRKVTGNVTAGNVLIWNSYRK